VSEFFSTNRTTVLPPRDIYHNSSSRKMWRTLTILVLVSMIGLTLADKPQPEFKGASLKKEVAAAPLSAVNSQLDQETAPSNKVVVGSVQSVAQDRQDSYGPPLAPAADTYGSPAAPVADTYGSPAAPVAAPPVQGEVGTQGYYYYYYPVANSQSPPSYSSHGSSASSSGGGGISDNIGVPILLVLGFGALVVVALVASFTTNNSGRSLTDLFVSNSADDLMYKVYEAIELWNEISA
jgi:hypothetical protein